MIRSKNPALSESTFEVAQPYVGAEAMTIQGTVNKTGLLLVLTVLPAAWVWTRFFETRDPATVIPWILVGGIGGFVMALVTVFKHTWAPVTAPMYAVLKGFFLGAISAIFELRYPGIAVQAVSLTFGTLFGLLLAYKSGMIRATENFKLGVVAATGGIFVIYLITMVLGFFGVAVPYIHQSGFIGIAFSAFVVIIAALNLVLDFDFIESGAERGAPKHMEWYGAFGLLVTLIWLYIEFLRLLAKLRDRR